MEQLMAATQRCCCPWGTGSAALGIVLGFARRSEGHVVGSGGDEGMTPRSSILAYLVPAEKEARLKVTRSPQGPALRLEVEGKNYL
jgi:hypothetical protein